MSETKENIETIFKIIDDNYYIKNCKSNIKKDINSISYLIDRQLSQSDCIKIGVAIEKLLVDIILKNNKNLSNVTRKNEINVIEKDHLFIDEINKIIYYAEIKSNLNLDTEKSKKTCEKIIEVRKTLIKLHKNYTIKPFLVNTRYLYKKDIPKKIITKYKNIDENVIGLNEYLSYVGSENIKINNEKEYKTILTYMANKMFK